jgi:hypothetical protein
VTPLLFIALCLACHRLSLMLTKEDGPYWLFRKIRRIPDKGTSAKAGISCIWCASVWFSFLLCLYSIYVLDLYTWGEMPIWWLSVSSGAIVINQQFTKG